MADVQIRVSDKETSLVNPLGPQYCKQMFTLKFITFSLDIHWFFLNALKIKIQRNNFNFSQVFQIISLGFQWQIFL